MAEPALLPRLGYRFSEPQLLRQALTHSSYGLPHNERLEFLGDGVLNCAIAALLCRRFPSVTEGDLSRLRANLVNQAALAEVAARLDLGTWLRLGEAELRGGGVGRPSILADALEAVWGAVYLDGGFEVALDAIERAFTPWLEALDPNAPEKDPKTRLQEWLQGRRMALPLYQLQQVSGAAHQQHFEVDCTIAALQITTRGEGASRRAAEQMAAGRALAALPSEHHSGPQVRGEDHQRTPPRPGR